MDSPKRPQPTSIFIRQNQEGVRSVTGFTLFLLLICGGVIPGILAYALGTTEEAQVVAIALGIIFMLFIFTVPFFGLVVYTGLLYTRPEESIPALAGMHLTLIIALITMLGMGLQLVLEKKRLVRTPLIGMMAGFALLGMLSGIMHGRSLDGISDFSRLLAQVLIVLNLLRTPERYRNYVTMLIVFTAYLALYSSYLYFSGTATIDQGLARSRGTGIFSDPNDLAATMIPGMVLALSRLWQAKGANKIGYALLTCTMIGTILLSNSRGGLIALVVSIGGFFLTFHKHKALALSLCAACLGLLMVLAPSRMTEIDSQEESANNRLSYWREGLSQLRQHPLTGVGYKAFPDVNEGFVAHNSFVNCYAELGFPAYFFWMGCIYYGYKKRPLAVIEDDSTLEKAEGTDTSGHALVSSQTEQNDSDAFELRCAQLALIGYLAAVFWITRTYSPIIYLIICLPLTKQLSGNKTANAGITSRDMVSIFIFSIVIIVIVTAFTFLK